MGRSSLWPWVLAAVAVVLAVSAFVLDALAGSHGDGWWLNVLVASAFAATAGVGLLVAVRRPGHPIGWLLQATAILLAASGTAAGYAGYSILEQPGALPGAEWAVLWDESAWPLLFGTLIAIVLVFPDGRLPSPRWRRAMIGAAAAFALLVILGLFDSEPFEAPYEKVDRPLPGLPGAFAVLWPVAFVGVLASLVAGVQAVRVRFRRARGIERLQLKWLTFTAGLVPVTLLICLSGSLLGGSADGDAFNALFFFMLGAIPASIGVAVLRYRLYDIDRVINRTLVYGALTVLLATAYGATALLLGTALGSGSAWATAGATLLVAVAFRPLRGAVQDAVDRRFSRARYDARRRIAGFLEDLRAGRAAPEAIEPVLREVLSDPRLELRFFLPETELYVDARGYPADDQPEDSRLRTPVTRAGAPLGMVLHSPFDEEDRPGLLNEVLEAAGLAIEIARLRVALRRQLDEVEASRARIVTAGYEERRRLERDLHDGAQQRLISIGLALRHAQHELGVAPDRASASIEAAVSEIAVASEELRELARGVRPAQLDAGLAAALEELADRAPLPVEVRAGGERYPHVIEAAAYFIASEGLTNVVKHSEAGRATLSASRRNGCLVISVSDDGVGGASPGPVGPCGGSRRQVRDRERPAGRHGPHGGAAVRIVIAEDQVLLREGLGRLFEDGGHEVLASLGDATRLPVTVAGHRPDLVVVDVRMPPTFTDEGARAAKQIKVEHPEVGVLVLSQHVETAHAVDLVSVGGFGYLLKGRVLDVGDFLAAAERVAAGGSALDPEFVARLVSPHGVAGGRLAELSDREREVLELMAEGLTNAGIANRLFLSERTVEAHVRQVLMKLSITASEAGHRRVLAVLAYLTAAQAQY